MVFVYTSRHRQRGDNDSITYDIFEMKIFTKTGCKTATSFRDGAGWKCTKSGFPFVGGKCSVERSPMSPRRPRARDIVEESDIRA